MKNNSTLLITGTTDILRAPTEIDNTCEEVFELTLPSKQKYTKKHGYDLLTLRSFCNSTINKFGIFKQNHLGFMRALRVFEMLEYYDTVMWIDADAIITNDTYTIQDFIKDDRILSVSWDWTGKKSFSTGNFVIKNQKNIKPFFDTFLYIAQQIVQTNTWGEEQTAFNWMYTNTSFKENIAILDHNFLNAVPSKSMLGEVWSTRPEIQFPWNKNCFLAHLTGIPNQNRIEILKRVFGEFL